MCKNPIMSTRADIVDKLLLLDVLIFLSFLVVWHSMNVMQATMLKKNKFKRRPTEPNILPANGEGGKSTED